MYIFCRLSQSSKYDFNIMCFWLFRFFRRTYTILITFYDDVATQIIGIANLNKPHFTVFILLYLFLIKVLIYDVIFTVIFYLQLHLIQLLSKCWRCYFKANSVYAICVEKSTNESNLLVLFRTLLSRRYKKALKR